MAGPTPVSALIHAATMVTAGLYMVTRTNVIFQHSQTMMLVVALVGAATAIFAATIGITQNDIKKVLAYSTVSQLGFMFMACGVGAFVIGIFHVMTHAFFKALMFLGAGSVIHGMHHEQDMRRMGGLKKYMPYTYMTFLAGWLAICGIIPFSGFWSKDEILWNAASTTHIPVGWLVWLVGTIAATCTAFYMTRLVAMTFWGKERFLEAPVAKQTKPRSLTTGTHDAHRSPTRRDMPGHVGSRSCMHCTSHSSRIADDQCGFRWLCWQCWRRLVDSSVSVQLQVHHRERTSGGRLNIVNWLDPIIWNPETREFGKEQLAAAKHTAPAAHGETHAAPNTQTEATLNAPLRQLTATCIQPRPRRRERSSAVTLAAEWIFIVISLVVAGIGMVSAYLFYVRRPTPA